MDLASPYRGYDYDIADEGLIRILHSRATAFHMVREHLMDLHVWSDEFTNHIGFRFQSICGEVRDVCAAAPDNASAAAILNRRLIDGLSEREVVEPEHQALRRRVVEDLTLAEPPPDPFEPILKYLADQAANLYGLNWPGVRFQIAAGTGRYYRESSTLYVNAETDLRIWDPRDCPVIRLSIWADRFNRETFAAIFAVCVHELICHVAAPRRPSDDPNSSAFAEGFADWAAEKLFDRWGLESDPKMRPSAQHFGRELWGLGVERGGGNRYWKQRVLGRTAADRVVSVLRGAGMPPRAAVDRVIVLACELVSLDVDLIEKDIFVGSLGLVSPTLRERLEQWAHGARSVRELLPGTD